METTVDSNLEVVTKFARAIAKATDFSINNYDQTFEIMKKVFPEQYMDEKIAKYVPKNIYRIIYTYRA